MVLLERTLKQGSYAVSEVCEKSFVLFLYKGEDDDDDGMIVCLVILCILFVEFGRIFLESVKAKL